MEPLWAMKTAGMYSQSCTDLANTLEATFLVGRAV